MNLNPDTFVGANFFWKVIQEGMKLRRADGQPSSVPMEVMVLKKVDVPTDECIIGFCLTERKRVFIALDKELTEKTRQSKEQLIEEEFLELKDFELEVRPNRLPGNPFSVNNGKMDLNGTMINLLKSKNMTLSEMNYILLKFNEYYRNHQNPEQSIYDGLVAATYEELVAESIGFDFDDNDEVVYHLKNGI